MQLTYKYSVYILLEQTKRIISDSNLTFRSKFQIITSFLTRLQFLYIRNFFLKMKDLIDWMGVAQNINVIYLNRSKVSFDNVN